MALNKQKEERVMKINTYNISWLNYDCITGFCAYFNV